MAGVGAWRSRVAVVGAAVTVLMVGLSGSGQRDLTAAAETPRTPNPPTNSGRPPGGAFLIDFTRPLDPETVLISNWYMDTGWIEATFEEDNAIFDDSGLTLVVDRKHDGRTPYISGEFQRTGVYGYGRYEAVMRPAAGEGVLSGFFTHTDASFGDPHSEVDFEFVGRSPRQVHLNYFLEGANDPVDFDLWFDATQGLHLYAFDWQPNSITWFVDNVEVRRVETKTAKVGIPTASTRLLGNILAANKGVVEWLGYPKLDRAAALYRCVSHVPAGQTGAQCSDSFTPPPRPAAR